MKQQTFQFNTTTTTCYFDADFDKLADITDPSQAIIITDQHIFELYEEKLKNWKTIVIEPGEENKQPTAVNYIIEQMIWLQADRETMLIGVGGGVITDITGYIASIYMRGIKFGLIPTSILGMVDAAVGGKNGVDFGIYKNLIGVIKHASFLFLDYSFLKTLPEEEWINGFAEIIKHACIKDKELFAELKQHTIEDYMLNASVLSQLIERNVSIKYKVVSMDENEKGDRKLLNFGHTIGHAIENKYQLPHGYAISIGMVKACMISEKILAFNGTAEIKNLLEAYYLPTNYAYDPKEVWDILLMDKKRQGDQMNFVLLPSIGEAVYKPVPLSELKILFQSVS